MLIQILLSYYFFNVHAISSSDSKALVNHKRPIHDNNLLPLPRASFLQTSELSSTSQEQKSRISDEQSQFRIPLHRSTPNLAQWKDYFNRLTRHHFHIRNTYHDMMTYSFPTFTDFIENNSTIKENSTKTIESSIAEQVRTYDIYLNDIKSSQFVGAVSIGTPNQDFDVIFDTGSSNLWLNGYKCNAPSCVSQPSFNPLKSTSFISTHIDTDVTFGTGAITGTICKETFHLGPIKVINQTFGMINNEIGNAFLNGKFQGILGLSFPSLSSASYTPVFDNIIRQKRLQKNMFGFYYNEKGSRQSVVEFGEPSEEYFIPPIQFIEVTTAAYWEMALKDIYIGDKALNLCPEEHCKIVADTGTSLLTGPSHMIGKILQQLHVPPNCDYGNMPNIKYVLTDSNGDHEFILEPEFYVIKYHKKCMLGLMAVDVPKPRGPVWILGEVFMQKFYTVFKRDPPAVGFAEGNHI